MTLSTTTRLSPSPYLEAARVRWADRGLLVRRDLAMVLEGFQSKTRFLSDLRQQIQRHRREDRDQLMEDRRQAVLRWDERLGRFAEWTAQAAALRGKARDGWSARNVWRSAMRSAWRARPSGWKPAWYRRLLGCGTGRTGLFLKRGSSASFLIAKPPERPSC